VLDKRVKTAWKGHPRHTVIDNSTAFADKLARATAVVLEGAKEVMGSPVIAP
jgi:hypothetical protein